jgi:chemotaxis protein CheD
MTVRPRERRLTIRSDPADFRSGVPRYRDPRVAATAVKVFPGEHYVTNADEMLVTVLGACVSVCIRDPVIAVGGMNHFMLPEAGGNDCGEASPGIHHGNVAMERLIDDILGRGGVRQRLEVKLFGGGSVPKGVSDFGQRNAAFVETYLAAENLPVAAAELRGKLARRVHYFPTTGRVMVLELRRAEDAAVVELEALYRSELARAVCRPNP